MHISIKFTNNKLYKLQKYLVLVNSSLIRLFEMAAACGFDTFRSLAYTYIVLPINTSSLSLLPLKCFILLILIKVFLYQNT